MVGTWNRWSAGDDFFRSTDGGATWKSLRQFAVFDTSLSPFLNYQVTFGVWNASIEIDPFDSNHALYDGGNTVWATNDLTNLDSGEPTHWTVGADGIEETVILDLVSPPAGAHLLSAVGDEGGFRHDDLNVSPVPFLNPHMVSVPSIDFAELNPLVMARVGMLNYSGDLGSAFSMDGGATWVPIGGTPPGAGAGSAVTGTNATVAVSADGRTYVWAPADAVPAYIRQAGWISSMGAPAGLRVVVDRVNPNKFYGYDPATGTVYVSTDGGASYAPQATWAAA